VMLVSLSVLTGAAWPGRAAAQQSDSCVTCHLATRDARLMRPVEAFRDDIHAARGFSCTACHQKAPRSPGMYAGEDVHRASARAWE